MRDVKKLLTETHDVKQVKDFYNYKGEEITHNSILVTDYNIKESMSKVNIEYVRQEYGVEMLDVILLKIFQLGFQQRAIQEEIKADEKQALDEIYGN